MVTVSMFFPAAEWVQEGIAAEVERLGKFQNTNIVLEFN
jgi:hypothetical protein